MRLAVRDGGSGFIHLTDRRLCRCRRIGSTDPTDGTVEIRADLTNVYAYSGRARSVRVIGLERDSVKNLDIDRLAAFGVACRRCQRMTASSRMRDCLLTRPAGEAIEVVEQRSSSVLLKLPHARPLASCDRPVPLPSSNYSLYYTRLLDADNRAPACDR